MTEHDHRFRLDTARQGDRQTLEVELDIDAPPEQVWRALTDAEELMRWFPFQAKVEPGEGGSIWMSWDGAFEDGLPIQAWEPGRHLRTGWPLPPPEGAAPVPDTVVDYHLEAKAGGGTVLRLVHSGFPTGDEWDEIFGSHRRGWSYELRSLRHYLEHHRGQSRRIARVRRPVTPFDEAGAWALLWSPEGLGAEAPGVGPYVLDLPSGHRLEGRVMVAEPPTDLGATVRALDGVAGSESSLFRVSIESWCGPGGPTELHMWLATWGVAAEDVASIQASWSELVDRMLEGAGG